MACLEEEGVMKHCDPYMERVQQQADPIVCRAQTRILRAARAALEARDELCHAQHELERHPDYVKTERARRKGKPVSSAATLAWWVHNGIRSVLEDALFEDAADWLFEDSNPRRAAAGLRAFTDTAGRDEAGFAHRAAKRKARPQKPEEPVFVPATPRKDADGLLVFEPATAA